MQTFSKSFGLWDLGFPCGVSMVGTVVLPQNFPEKQ